MVDGELGITVEETRRVKAQNMALTKILRCGIDGIIKQAQALKKSLGRGEGGREISLVITKLQEGKMWGGMILGALGSELPEQFRDESKAV